MSHILTIDQLSVSVEGTRLLDRIDLKIARAELHAVMGENGSGKSTLAQTLAGRGDFQITQGAIKYKDRDLTALAPADRARAGLFVSFQSPIDLPGVRMMSFLQASVNARREGRGEAKLNPADFLRYVRDKAALLDMDQSMLKREVNVGFSGGERKRFEALQILLLEPELAIIDEIDSGLDMNALQLVAGALSDMRGNGMAIVLITHYPRLLDLLKPDRVHILHDGRIARSGDRALADEIERGGYRLSKADAC